MKKTTNTHLSFALPIGYELLGKYKILKVLNHIQYGFEYLVETINEMDKRTYIIKEFFPNECVIRGNKGQMLLKASLSTEALVNFNFLRKIFEGEIKNLWKISGTKHTNIIKLIGVLENKNNTSYMILSYEKGVTLQEYLDKRKEEERQLSNEEIYNIINPLLDMVEHIHQLDIYHLDIKPENIIIKEDGTPVLLGFYASTMIYDEYTKKYHNIHTPEYASPEQISVENTSEIDQRSDIYSLGVLLYYLITNELPPKAEVRKKFPKDDLYIPLIEHKVRDMYDTSLLAAADKALSISKKHRFKNLSQFKNAILAIKSVSGQKVKKKRKVSWYLFGFMIPLFVLFIYFGWKVSTEKLELETISENNHLIKYDTKKVLNKEENKVDINKSKSDEKEKNDKQKTILNNKKQIIKESEKIIEKRNKNLMTITPIKTLNTEKVVSIEKPKNEIKISIDVTLSKAIGKTKIKVNGKEYSDGNILLKRKKAYYISIENPYYRTLKVERTYDELLEFPVQNFMLVEGKGKVHLNGLPMGTEIKVYEVEKNQTKILDSVISYSNGMYEVVVKSGKKFYMLFTNVAYESFQTEMMILMHGEALTLTYDLEKKDTRVQDIKKQLEHKERVEKKKDIVKNIVSVRNNKKTSVKEKSKKRIKNKDLTKNIAMKERKKIKSKMKKKVKKKQKRISKKKLTKRKRLSEARENNQASSKTKVSAFVWYCNAKAIGSEKISAKDVNKLVAQQRALRKCNRVQRGCKILNCFLLRN
jgi:serine/threonine protein kinase